MEIQFVRSVGYYVLRIYIPAILLVVVSFVSFLMNKKATNMRLGFPAASLFALIFFAVYISHESAKISYIKATDVHIVCCIIMVLLVMAGKLKIMFLLITLYH